MWTGANSASETSRYPRLYLHIQLFQQEQPIEISFNSFLHQNLDAYRMHQAKLRSPVPAEMNQGSWTRFILTSLRAKYIPNAGPIYISR